MTPKEREVMELALEALERGETELRWKAITAIKDALANHIEYNLAMVAQPEQEPVGHRDGYWCDDLTCKKCYSADFRFKHKNSVDKESLTTEAQRTAAEGEGTRRAWVGLDNDDLVWIYSNSDKVGQAISNTEAKLKAKNERKEKNTRTGGCS